LLLLSKQGFPINKESIVAAVQSLLIAENIANPFLNDVPGRSWFYSFLKRFPDLHESMNSTGLNSWKGCSKERWQGLVKDAAAQRGISEALKSAPRIICCDMISFTVSLKTGECLVKFNLSDI
jgi:hypothetical protein